MPTKEQQEEINKAQLATIGETLETFEAVKAGIKEDAEKAAKEKEQTK